MNLHPWTYRAYPVPGRATGDGCPSTMRKRAETLSAPQRTDNSSSHVQGAAAPLTLTLQRWPDESGDVGWAAISVKRHTAGSMSGMTALVGAAAKSGASTDRKPHGISRAE